MRCARAGRIASCSGNLRNTPRAEGRAVLRPFTVSISKAKGLNDLFQLAGEAEQAPQRELPYSLEAEQAILGGLLRDNRAWARVSDQVDEQDFFRHDHRMIFRSLAKLAEDGVALDLVTLQGAVTTVGTLEECGGPDYLAEIAANTPSVANIVSYARVVRERAVLRKIIGVANDTLAAAMSPSGRSADDLVHEAEQNLMAVSGQRPKEGGPVSVDQLLSKAISKIDAAHQPGGEAIGLPTGYVDLDLKLNNLRPADLVIVAGRPSMGKTTFAMNLVENAVLKSEKVVMVYSLEMPGDSLVTRMLSSVGSIDQSRIRSGRLRDEDWPKLSKASHLLSRGNRLFIDDTAGLTASEMRTRTRRVLRAHGEIGLIMVDYLQLMQVPAHRRGNRTNEISEISRALKALAKEFDCPVVALSQLNRSVEQRANKRPVNSDLRESGAIEQDADVILFLYRDEVYHPNSPYQGTAEIIIGKQREGPVGFIRLGFQGKYTRFVNLEAGSHQFTDAEMGVEQVELHPRIGRAGGQHLATNVKAKAEGKGRPSRGKGARKPP